VSDTAQGRFEEALVGGRRPAIFMFQPNKFDAVTTDRLAEWEYSIKEYFGLPSLEFDEEALLASATWSNCGDGRICADDSDYQDVSGGDYANPSERLDKTLAEGRRPTIFMWQPSRFELVAGEKLAEWERQIREHVGMPVSEIRSDAGGSACLSATLPNDCMDDSDYLSE
jgi:hypothetical protein